MSGPQKTSAEPGDREKKRFRDAQKSLRRMLEEIAPFAKKHDVRRFSSAGRWREASSCLTSRPGAAPR